jgi:hypothetical protein
VNAPAKQVYTLTPRSVYEHGGMKVKSD